MDRWKNLLENQPPAPQMAPGNRLALLSDGDAAFRAMWQAISEAERRVWLNTYIYAPDAIGKQTLDALVDAAERGCDVILLYDQYGSTSIGRDFTEPLRRAGGRAVAFNPAWPVGRLARRTGYFMHRDHRKNLIVDDDTAFVGGMNINVDYGGEELGTGRFCDVMLRVEGPAVRDLADVFLASLRETADLERPRLPETEPLPEGVPVQVLGLDTPENHDALNRALREAVQKARERCYLTTPYFVPPDWLIASLADAARRGVDVRLLTAGRTEVRAVRMAGRHVYGTLLESGVRIYEMTECALHAKDLVIDDAFCSVGSYNIDRWSSRHNLELNVAAVDAALASRLREEFFENLKLSSEVSLEAWRQRPAYKRPLQWAAYQFLQM